LPTGIYEYIPEGHELTYVLKEDRRADLCKAAFGQDCLKEAPLVIVFTGIYERISGKYGEKGIRFSHMEAGHASQNVYLQCISLNLGTVAVGGFSDGDVKKLLPLEDNEEPLYLMPLGKK